jgi:hypothetical protein
MVRYNKLPEILFTKDKGVENGIIEFVQPKDAGKAAI